MYVILWRFKAPGYGGPWHLHDKTFNAKDACWRYAVAMSRDPDYKDREIRYATLGDLISL